MLDCSEILLTSSLTLFKINGCCVCFDMPDNRPPAMVPNKGKYMFKDLQLLAKYFNVPLGMPKVSFLLVTVKP